MCYLCNTIINQLNHTIMAILISVKKGEIYYNSKRLSVEIEYYKTVVHIHIYDYTKAFPLLDTVKVKRSNKHEYGLLARDYAIAHNLF